MNLFAFWGRETKAKPKVVREDKERIYIGELIQEECFEREMGEKV